MNLLVLNYSMNPKSLVFSHQSDVVKRLSDHFEKTFVITADEEFEVFPTKLVIKSSYWKNGKTLKSALRFYRTVLPLMFSQRKRLVVFSHMTEVQSFLIAPICRILGIRHFLWYAHTSQSNYLRLSFPFLNGIITSTPGSCPVKGSKVHPIGQAIDHKIFNSVNSIPLNPPLRWYHIGRMDKSKNIDLIIEVFKQLRKEGWNLTLDFYGDSSSESTKNYLKSLTQKYFSGNHDDWLKYHGAVERNKIPRVAELYDGFIHAFQGSLDKAVLEATMCKRIVVSINPEFESEFNHYDSGNKSLFDKLSLQLLSALEMPKEEQGIKIERFFKKTQESHSLDNWISKLLMVISN